MPRCSDFAVGSTPRYTVRGRFRCSRMPTLVVCATRFRCASASTTFVRQRREGAEVGGRHRRGPSAENARRMRQGRGQTGLVRIGTAAVGAQSIYTGATGGGAATLRERGELAGAAWSAIDCGAIGTGQLIVGRRAVAAGPPSRLARRAKRLLRAGAGDSNRGRSTNERA